jgi:hypothetical protein
LGDFETLNSIFERLHPEISRFRYNYLERFGEQMDFVRVIIDSEIIKNVIPLPDSLANMQVEVIVLPLDAEIMRRALAIDGAKGNGVLADPKRATLPDPDRDRRA